MFFKRPNNVCLRKYPYPYQCALTICSDIDNTRTEDFIETHKFLNTDLETNMGRGIGLEIGDSFWMFNANYETDKNDFSYFKGTSDQFSDNKDIIAAFIRAGFIDCLHTYGNFSGVGGFRREMALKAIEELKKNDLRIIVWIDHGDMHNFQDITTPTSLGDSPYRISADGTQISNYEYHTDLTIASGIKFIWTNLTDIWGQDRLVTPLEVIFKKKFIRRLILDIANSIIGNKNLKEVFSQLPFINNKLINVYKLRDGNLAYGFTRYGQFGKDNAEWLTQILSEKNLQELMRKKAVSIVYVHFGKKRFGEERIFSHPVISSLRRLEGAYRSGDIFVTTTSRLLTYCLMRDQLNWDVEKNQGGISIIIKPGNYHLYDQTCSYKNCLQGITFYVEDPEKTKIFFLNEELKINRNAKDHTGHYSVSVPLEHLSTKDILKTYQGRPHEKRL